MNDKRNDCKPNSTTTTIKIDINDAEKKTFDLKRSQQWKLFKAKGKKIRANENRNQIIRLGISELVISLWKMQLISLELFGSCRFGISGGQSTSLHCMRWSVLFCALLNKHLCIHSNLRPALCVFTSLALKC